MAEWQAGAEGGGGQGHGTEGGGELARCLSSLLDLVLWRSSSLVWLWVSSIEGEAELEATHPVHYSTAQGKREADKSGKRRGEHKEEKEKEKAPAPVPGTASTAQGLQQREERGLNSTRRRL